MYFRKFPQVDYDVTGNGVTQKMIDITRRVRVLDSTLLNYVNFDFYDVRDGERPEHIAANYYKDPTLYWIILLANNIKDVYTDWPMTVNQFETFVASKYDDVNAIHHYEVFQESGDTKLKLEYPNDPATTVPVDATPVTNYEYEEEIQNTKRRIRLIRPQYISRIKTEFENKIRG